MDDKITDQSLERIIDLLEEGTQIRDEDMAQLMQDEEAFRIYKELNECKNAIKQEYSNNTQQINREWGFFLKAKKKKAIQLKVKFVAAIAASLLILVLFSWWKGNQSTNESVIVFEANDDIQQVMLKTTTGNQIALTPGTSGETLESIGTQLDKTDTLQLQYLAEKSNRKETHILSTPRGRDFKVMLSDGTIVWLNAESQLEYPTLFEGEERVVSLQGEAYFSVKKDPKHPFIVRSRNLQTRVLGTELNIRDYVPHDSHVTLVEGCAEVADSKGDSYTRLKPGEDAMLKEDGSFLVKEVDVDTYIYWKEGYFYFDNTNLLEVMQSLGRWYNLNIVFNNKKAMELRMHYFCNRNDSPQQAINLLNRMKKINIKLVNDTIFIE